jgi:hypothetical protein
VRDYFYRLFNSIIHKKACQKCFEK